MIISAIIALWRRNADGWPSTDSGVKIDSSRFSASGNSLVEPPGIAEYAKMKEQWVALQARCFALEAENARLRRWNAAAWPYRRAGIVAGDQYGKS